ncbi:MAG: KH domain-containing protein [Acidobacteria bacterium]|nr:MAG: KH domain-containing protein [Acidobacteriota bacterium]
MTAVRDVIETVAKALADSPQRVAVTETEHRGTTLVEVTVAPPDVGKLIGRQGRTIQAMRTIAAIAGERLGKRVTLEVRD